MQHNNASYNKLTIKTCELLTFTLNRSELWDDLYKAGNCSMLSALQYRSKRPIAIGGAAVKTCNDDTFAYYKHTTKVLVNKVKRCHGWVDKKKRISVKLSIPCSQRRKKNCSFNLHPASWCCRGALKTFARKRSCHQGGDSLIQCSRSLLSLLQSGK